MPGSPDSTGICACRPGLDFINCVFTSNYAGLSARGGAIYANAGILLDVANSTFVLNDTNAGIGGAIYHDACPEGGASLSLTIRNSILWDNESTPYFTVFQFPIIKHSCIEGFSTGYDSNGNTGSDPLFIHTLAGFRLACGSSAINRASESLLEQDDWDLNQDGLIDDYNPDSDTLPRIVGNVPDMGAFEASPTSVCVPDINGDCSVNVDDLVALIGSWGACPAPCAADFLPATPCPMPDGVVDVNELVWLIGSWGPCPNSGCTGESHFPTSISDCWNVYCTGLSGEDYESCLSRCVTAYCSQTPTPADCE